MSDGSIKIDTKIDQAGVKKGLKEMNTNIRDTMGKLATFGKASLGVMAAAIGAIAAATGKWLKEADRIDKVSQQIGVTKKTFQELDYVMKQNGASIDAFSMGAKTLQQNMVSNSQAFKTLGVEIRNTDGSLRSQDDVMKDVIRKFETMEQGVEKSALAQDIFGRSAQDLMPMLNQQTGSMDKLIKKANDMGAVMRDDVVMAAVDLGDIIEDLKVSISSLLNTVIAPFVPALSKVAEWMENLSGSVSGTIGMHTNLGKETNTLITATNNYKTAVQNLDGAQKDITDTERTLLKGRKELARLALEKALAETSKGYAKTTEQVAKLKKEEADRIAAVGRYSLLMKQYEIIANGPADAARAASTELGISISTARESYGKAARSFEAENLKLIETQTKLTAVSTEQAEAIAEIARAVNAGTLNIDIYKTTNRDLYNAIMASAEAQKTLNKEVSEKPKKTIAEELIEETQELIEKQEELEKVYNITAKTAAILNDKVLAGIMTEREERKALVSLYESQIDALYQMGATSDGSDEKSAALREYIKIMNRMKKVSGDIAPVAAKGLRGVLLAIRDKSSGIVNQVKVMMGKMSDVIGSGFSFIKGVFSKGFSLLPKLAKFDPNAMLASLQEFLTDLENFFTVDLALSPVWLKSAFEMIGSFLSGIIKNLPAIMETFDNAIDGLVTLIVDYGPGFIKSAGKIILSFIKGIAKAFPKLVKAAGPVIMALIKGLADAAPQLVTAAVTVIMSFVEFILDNLPELIMAGVQIIIALINGIGQALPSLIYAIVNALPEIISAIITAFPMIVQAIVDNLPAIIEAVCFAIPMIVKAITDNLPAIIEAVIFAIPMIVQAIVDNFPAIIEAVIYAITIAIPLIAMAIIQSIPQLIVAVLQVAYALVEGLWNGIGAAFTGLFKGLGDLFWEWIIKPIRKLFKMHSPSVVFSGLGGDMIQGLINGILSAGGAIWNAVKGIFTGLWDNIKNVFSGAWDLGKSVVSAIGDGIKGVASGAVDLAGNAWSAIASGASSLISSAGSALSKLKFWDVGSPNISADHVAMVHKGERIVPKTFNQDLMSGNTMMLAPEALSSIMASFTGLGRQSVNISGVVPVMINDREIGRAAFEWLDVAAGGAYGY